MNSFWNSAPTTTTHQPPSWLDARWFERPGDGYESLYATVETLLPAYLKE